MWQRLLWVVMFLVVFEGAVRKWVLPGFQAQIFFVKDLILIAAYGAFLAASPRSGAHALDVDDPYYGDPEDFEDVFAVIEASLPGLHAWVDERLAQNGQG